MDRHETAVDILKTWVTSSVKINAEENNKMTSTKTKKNKKNFDLVFRNVYQIQ